MNTKITAIGELLFDIFGSKRAIGGAPFNFTYHLNMFNQQSDIVTCLGDDKDSEQILSFIREHDIQTKYIRIDPTRKTGRVIVKLNENKVPVYNIKKNVAYDFIELSEKEKQQIIKKSAMIYYGTLSQRNIVSRNTVQSLLTDKTINFCDLNLRQQFYNKDLIEASLQKCDILKINEDELKIISQLFFSRISIFKIDVMKLINLFNLNLVAVTRGEKGAKIFSRNESFSFIPKQSTIVDTVGAGDAYAAVLAFGIMNNINIRKINRIAVSFASEVCKTEGALLHEKDIYEKYKELITND